MVLARVYSGEKLGADQPLEIVGVVKDVRNDSLWQPEADLYVPFQQHPAPSVFLVVRTAGPPMGVVPAVRGAVLALDKEQPVNDIRTMSEIVSQTYGAIRFPMTLLWIFAALALVLSAVGIFGVMSYTVSRRTQEISSTDPLSLVAASLLLTLVAMLASYLPARRATRVNPITALRYE